MHSRGRRNVETRTSVRHNKKPRKIHLPQETIIGSIEKVLSTPKVEPKNQNQHPYLAIHNNHNKNKKGKKTELTKHSLHEKCPSTTLFLVCIFP